MRHRRSVVSSSFLALVLPACFSPRDPIVVGDDESGGSTGGSAESGSEGPSTSASTSATSGPTTTEPSTTDPDGSSGGSESGDPVCGDGMVEGDEVCDDGTNDGSYGGCNADCGSLGPHCGDAVTQAEEACDDGDDINGNGCNIDCIESGTVLWTRTLDEGYFRDVAVDGDDVALAVGGTPRLRAFDVDGNDGWMAEYDYPGATSTTGTKLAFHPTLDWIVGGTASVPNESINLWWRGYSVAGAGGTTSFFDNPAHTGDHMGGVAFDDAGNLYVFGGSNRDDLGQGTNIWLRKHDTGGDELWTQSYDGGEDDVAHAIAVGADDYVVVGGYTYEDGDRQAWLRKYGPEGNTMWTRTVGSDGVWDEIHDLAVGPDLEVVAAGVEGYDLWVRKYSADGDAEWTDTHGHPFMCVEEGCLFSDSGNGVAVDSSGAVIVVGDQMTSIRGVDILVRKYDSDGTELWTDIVSAANPDDCFEHTATAVAVTSTDDIVVVGAWDETGIGGDVLPWIRKYAP